MFFLNFNENCKTTLADYTDAIVDQFFESQGTEQQFVEALRKELNFKQLRVDVVSQSKRNKDYSYLDTHIDWYDYAMHVYECQFPKNLIENFIKFSSRKIQQKYGSMTAVPLDKLARMLWEYTRIIRMQMSLELKLRPQHARAELKEMSIAIVFVIALKAINYPSSNIRNLATDLALYCIYPDDNLFQAMLASKGFAALHDCYGHQNRSLYTRLQNCSFNDLQCKEAVVQVVYRRVRSEGQLAHYEATIHKVIPLRSCGKDDIEIASLVLTCINQELRPQLYEAGIPTIIVNTYNACSIKYVYDKIYVDQEHPEKGVLDLYCHLVPVYQKEILDIHGEYFAFYYRVFVKTERYSEGVVLND